MESHKNHVPNHQPDMRHGQSTVDGCEFLHQLVDGLSMFISSKNPMIYGVSKLLRVTNCCRISEPSTASPFCRKGLADELPKYFSPIA